MLPASQLYYIASGDQHIKSLPAYFVHSAMQINKYLAAFTCLFLLSFALCSQSPAGKLFIIGGGDRPPALMEALIKEAGFGKNDYAVVLPMSGSNPDTSFYYFKSDWDMATTTPIYNLHFTKLNNTDPKRLDSLKQAKLVFITGGDQDRFMNAVLNTPVYAAIHEAYQKGATIAGTSAGAAVMCEHMITGTQLTDTVYRATFPRIVQNNVEFKTGLGLISTAIIDQHFIVRSRYNRLLSAIATYPKLTGIGIDEETAIVVQGNKARVVGLRQVVVFKNPRKLKVTKENRISFASMDFSLFTAGDEFTITGSN